jgi:hypothetical protein
MLWHVIGRRMVKELYRGRCGKAAASKAERIAPLKDCPLTIFEDVFKMQAMFAVANPFANILRLAAPHYSGFGYLMVNGVAIELSERFNIGSVKCVHLSLNKITGSHGRFTAAAQPRFPCLE